MAKAHALLGATMAGSVRAAARRKRTRCSTAKRNSRSPTPVASIPGVLFSAWVGPRAECISEAWAWESRCLATLLSGATLPVRR